jgi:hypothetical protein
MDLENTCVVMRRIEKDERGYSMGKGDEEVED